MSKIVENVDNWNPYFLKYDSIIPTVIYYERSWFCNENKTIHKSQKDYINCKECNSDSDREKYFKLNTK